LIDYFSNADRMFSIGDIAASCGKYREVQLNDTGELAPGEINKKAVNKKAFVLLRADILNY